MNSIRLLIEAFDERGQRHELHVDFQDAQPGMTNERAIQFMLARARDKFDTKEPDKAHRD